MSPRTVILALLAAALTALAPAPSRASGPDHREANARTISGPRRTLDRIHDPVIVPVRDLGDLPTRDASRLRLVRFAGDRMEPTPFQLDPRDARGEIVVDGETAIEPLDANDELVFMARDAGDRAPGDPCSEACEAALEIEIVDPLTHERAWAYLLAYGADTEPPPLSTAAPYVTIDDGGRVARSDSYRVEYAPERNYFTGLSVSSAAGGRGVDLLRQSRMHGSPTFSLLLTDVTLDFTEENSIVEIDGFRSGPVRAVRRARLSVDLGALFPELPSGVAYTYHYATSYLTPTQVSFPWIMLKTLRDFRFESTLDFEPAGTPTRYFDAGNPEGLSLVADAGEVRMSGDHEWWAHSSDAGTVLHAFVIPEEWKQWGIERGTIVRASRGDDATSTAGGGDGIHPPGARRAAGYTLLNMTRLREAGTFDLMMASVVLLQPFRAGDERAPLAMLQSPLRAAAERVH